MPDSLASRPTEGRSQPMTPVNWARFWFSQLAKHHRVHDPARWSFTEEHVIDFLQFKLKTQRLQGKE